MEKVINIINGKFGNKVLKPKYCKIWKAITYSFIAALVMPRKSEVIKRK